MRTPQARRYEPDTLFLPDRVLSQFAETVPTPFFLFDERSIRARCRALHEAFSWHGGHRQFFPVKATPIPAVLRILREEGFGALCTTATELMLAERAGFSGDQLLFFSGSPTPEDADHAAKLGAGLILDCPEQMGFYLRNGGLREVLGLRVRPAEPLKINGIVAARAGDLRFGCVPRRILDCVRQMRECGVKQVGLHAQLSEGGTRAGYYPALARMLCGLAEQAHRELPIAYLDLGGGLMVGSREGRLDVDLAGEQPGLRAVWESAGLAGTPLYTELGRWVTAKTAILVTRIGQVRAEGKDLQADLDLSFSSHLPRVLHGAYHLISLVGDHRVDGRVFYRLTGSSAEEKDRVRDLRCLPKLKRGDLLAVHDVGAYAGDGRSGGRPGLAAYLYGADGQFTCIRNAERPEAYLLRFPDQTI